MDIDFGAKEIIDKLYKEGYEGYIVGGCVRDIIMKKSPKDWDITTNANPQDVKRLFRKTIDTGIKHGTVTVRINKVSYEVTTYRIDGEYIDNRRPEEVFFTDDIEKDLERRDFTMNAIAFNHREGIRDYFGGISDIEKGIIKCVGEAEKRFEEDALRIMRGIRFTAQLGFAIEEKTLRAMKSKAHLLTNISKERIREEFDKILCGEYSSKALRIMVDTGVMDIILPELMPCVGFDQKNPNHNKDIFEHTLTVIENSRIDKASRAAALFHDIGKPKCFTIDNHGIGHFYGHEEVSCEIAKKIMKRLKYDTKTIELVMLVIGEHMTAFENITKRSTIKRFINRVGAENLGILFDFKRADIKGTASVERVEIINQFEKICEEILEYKEPFSIKDLAVNGNDMINLGYSGSAIGAILKKLLEIVIEEPEKNEKEYLSEIAKKERG